MRRALPGLMRALGASFLLAACAPESPPSHELIIGDATPLVTAQSGALASPVDVVTGANGDSYVLDARLAQVIVVGPDGTVRGTIGRNGAGPGELRQPRAMALSGDTLRVVDQGNNRVQLFSVTGRHLATSALAAGTTRGPLSIRPDGWIAAGTAGFDSVLAAYFDPQGVRRGTFGTPIVPPVTVWDFVAIKNQIAAGEVPALLRNIALPVFREQGGFWLAFGGEPLVQRFDSAGDVAAGAALVDPALDAIRADFFEKNRREASPARFASLNYTADAASLGEDLWLLLQVPDSAPSVLLVIAPDGAVRHRLVFHRIPGATAFAVDVASRRIVLASYWDATLTSARLPPLLP